jgi:hypothetical protein
MHSLSDGAAFSVLQFRAGSKDPVRDTRDGGGRHEAPLGK